MILWKKEKDMKNSREIAAVYEKAAKVKTEMSTGKLLVSGIFAGAFIAFGGIGSQIAQSSITDPGLARYIGALVFPVGLMMVLTVGAELFTGNCLLVLPLLQQKITVGKMLRNWGLVYLGNLIGSLMVACLVVYSGLPSLFGGALGETIVNTAAAKASLSPSAGLLRGILCNILVCLAVWISFAADEQAGKIIGLFLPTMLFVLCGFEHSIANMYFIPAGMMAQGIHPLSNAVSFSGFLSNLLPVTFGNILGGAGFVAAGLFFLYGRND